jgi:hypothetical protein
MDAASASAEDHPRPLSLSSLRGLEIEAEPLL